MKINCKELKGSIKAICSKSQAHRYMICCFLAGKFEEIEAIDELIGPLSEDIIATKECLEALNSPDEPAFLRCRESGTSLRALMPLAAALGRDVVFLLEKSLANRPIAALEDELTRHGAVIVDEGVKISVMGKLEPGEYRMSGNVSSQYTTGLLFALSALEGDSEIYLDRRPQSMPYIDMTINAMKNFGVNVDVSKRGRGLEFKIKGGQKYEYTDDCRKLLEGDWSTGAMWLAAKSLLNNSIEIEGLEVDSLQGDKQIASIIKLYEESRSSRIEIDVTDIPDIVPAIALRAIAYEGTTEIINAGRLRYKESDRLDAITSILNAIGADVREGTDTLTIIGTGKKLLPGSDSVIETFSDHRMVMLAAFSSIITEKAAIINEPEAVRKSYPSFFEDIKALGGETVTD